MITKIIAPVMLFAILGAFVYPNVNKSYAAPFIRLSVPMTAGETQFLPNQLSLHIDNQTNGGAVEVLSNETGQNVTQYFKYHPDSSVIVDNSSIYLNSKYQRPLVNDPNTIEIIPFRFNTPVKYVTNYDDNSTFPSKTYQAFEENWTYGNTTYDRLNVQVNIPKDMDQYQAMLIMFPSMNR
jgi:hypothetical protein